MANSMTGFGRCELSKDNNQIHGRRKICVEMKSVNHRYMDINIRLPKKLNAFEGNIRNEVKKYVSRGKIDMFVTYEDLSDDSVTVAYNNSVAKEYVDICKSIAEEFDIPNDLSVTKLARFPDVIITEDKIPDEEELWKYVSQAIDGACEQLSKSRHEEGERLKTDILSKLDDISDNTDFIASRAPKIVEEFKLNLQEKVKELLDDVQIDENRIISETTIYADKICVDEEIVRLKSHVESIRNTLIKKNTDIGRQLDFVAQEMNREANTILSKTNDIEVGDRAILLKTDIEKIREQVQNIE